MKKLISCNGVAINSFAVSVNISNSVQNRSLWSKGLASALTVPRTILSQFFDVVSIFNAVIERFFTKNILLKYFNIPLFSYLRSCIRLMKHGDIGRSSRRRCSIEKGVLKNFAKFIGKHPCQSLFLKQNCRPQTCCLIKKETL